MYNTANMTLTVWDQIGDDFNHTQLTNNWNAIDQHDHSNGRGVQLGTASIAPGAITSTLIASNAVGPTQLSPNSVGTVNIQNGAIIHALLASGSVFGSVIAPASVTSAMLDPTVVPLGSVTMYWRPSGSTNLPGGGWEIMDGRPWNTVSNSLGLSAGNMPDMRGVFPIGADITGGVGPVIGTTGGSNTANLAHSHAVAAHNHAVPVHSHPIASDGGHNHTFAGGFQIWTRPNAFLEGITVFDWNNHQQGNIFESLYLRSFNNLGTQDQPGPMDTAGAHNHFGFTQLNSAMSTANATSNTDVQLGTISTVPQNVALLFIMKVR